LYLFAFGVSVQRAWRLRHPLALTGIALAAYLIVADLLGRFAAHDDAGGFFGLFSTVFIGPTASPLRAAALLPLPAPLITQPLWLRALRCAICWSVAWACLRESRRRNPLLPHAYALDSLALPIAAAGVVDAIEAVILLWAQLMLGADAAFLPR
ncbi:MAG: hypothetical protein ABW321_06540, partial [Polyangiales bacterium]